MRSKHFRGRRFPVVLALLGVTATAAVLGVSASAGAAATSQSMKFVGQASTGLLTKISQTNHIPSGITPDASFVACQGNTPVLPTGPCQLAPPAIDDGGSAGAPAFVPHVASSTLQPKSGTSVRPNFLGVTDISQRRDTGYHYTPPDQALCVGPAGPWEAVGLPLGLPADQSVVFEGVNDAWSLFDTAGNELYHGADANLFSDANSSGDPECTYDSKTGAYFFTEIGAPNNQYYTTNLAVISPSGYGAYYLDSSVGGGYCFPDFPHQGTDSHALYITIVEFCGPHQDTYGGSNIYALQKSAIAALAPGEAVNGVAFSTGVFDGPFRAADGAGGTEYLVSSDQNSYVANDLQVASVTGDSALDSGKGHITLSTTYVKSEAYAEPIDAASTGDDSTCVYNFGPWCSVPEASLSSVDDRVEQVQYSHGLLVTSLPTSMTVDSDPTTVDGAAWFAIDTKKMKIAKQGYVGVAGTNLLMPSVVMSKYSAPMQGSDAPMGKKSHFIMSFSMTGPTLNPSTGYVTSTNSGAAFSDIVTTGVGAGPHVSYSTFYPGYDRRRWGDYSRIAIDPADGSVWSAQEYVPSGDAGADPIDNWGTQVWQLGK